MGWKILKEPHTVHDYLVKVNIGDSDQMDEDVSDELMNMSGRKIGKWGLWEVSTEDNFADPIYISTPYEQPPKTFICEACEKAFAAKGSLTNHKKLCHK